MPETYFKLELLWKTMPNPVATQDEFNSPSEAWHYLSTFQPHELHLLLEAKIIQYAPSYQIQLVYDCYPKPNRIELLPEIYESRYKAWEATQYLKMMVSDYTDNLVSVTILRNVNQTPS